jgi:hypothetical protein
MAISNYTELQSFIGQWAHRSDLVSVIPDLIRLAEAQLNRVIRTKSQDTVTDLTASASSRFLAFPSRMSELCDLSIVIDGTQQRLQQIGTEQFYPLITDSTGRPSSYAVRDQIEFNCLPDQAYTVKCHYIKSLDIAADSTNYVLTNYPDAYLFATMAQVDKYIKADPTYYIGMLDSVVRAINTNEARSKSSTLVTDLVGASSFNIIQG